MKKLIPFAVLNKIQPLIDEHSNLLKVVIDPNFSFWFIDADSDSDFYFKVNHRIDSNGKHKIEYKPVNQDSVSASAIETDIAGVVQVFSAWIDILDKYAKIQTVYDTDPILQQYQDEFFNELKIDEPDADSKPFDFTAQLHLDIYLKNIKGLLTDFKKSASDEQKFAIASIELDCDHLHHDIPLISKNETLKRLSKIWAKGHKYSLDLIKEMLKEIRKEAISWIAKNVIENPAGLFNTIQGLLGN
jgi:hypothetical protein